MNVIDTINALANTSLVYEDLKYCLIKSDKRPFRIDNLPARPNCVDDFVSFDKLLDCKRLHRYAGIGISIQASDVCAIDVDHCFKTSFDINTADSRAKDILDMFKNIAYCEFSFSGHGLRVIFKTSLRIDNAKYYIKNSINNIEYYQPGSSNRYVTVTGKTISNITLDKLNESVLEIFLDKYMKREIIISKTEAIESVKSFEQLMIDVKKRYFKNTRFQDLWFGKAPGSGSNESELDYQLLAEIFENITQDKEMLRKIFETSPYFKSKDDKHIHKWEASEHRYFNYIYNILRSKL